MTSPRLVHFPHPGPEHRPRGREMAWNRDSHARKYMLVHGEISDATAAHEGQLVFWGEWEGASRVLKEWPNKGELPRFLHEPYWSPPAGEGFRQNTDPWVFGERFRYSNCKQLTPQKRPSALQDLTEGSVIFFGSGKPKERRFVLDTVFVVGRILGTFSPREPEAAQVDERFRIGTIESLATCPPGVANASFTLYEGATRRHSVSGMYSFAPCLPADQNVQRFARPDVELPGIINPASTQTPSGAKDPRSIEEVTQAWSSVVDQVLNQDLLLATRMDLGG